MDISDQHVKVDSQPSEDEHKISWGELAMSLVLLALGIVVVVDGLSQPESTSASGIGAGLFPVIVGVVLVTVSLFLCLQVLRLKRGEPEDAEGDVDVSRFHWWQAAIVVGAIIVFIVTIDVIGYIPAASITFWVIAFALGARHHVRSAIIAIVLGTAVYFLFTLVLRIDLPAGVLGGSL